MHRPIPTAAGILMPAPDGQDQTTFARDLVLFDATMIGVGAMIGAGIFVLTGLPPARRDPPRSWPSRSMAA